MRRLASTACGLGLYFFANLSSAGGVPSENADIVSPRYFFIHSDQSLTGSTPQEACQHMENVWGEPPILTSVEGATFQLCRHPDNPGTVHVRIHPKCSEPEGAMPLPGELLGSAWNPEASIGGLSCHCHGTQRFEQAYQYCIPEDYCGYGTSYNGSISKCSPPPQKCPSAGNPTEIATGRKTQTFTDYQGKNLTITRETYQNTQGAIWGFSLTETATLNEHDGNQFISRSNGATTSYLIKQSDQCWKQPGGRCMQVELLSAGLKITNKTEIQTYNQTGQITQSEIIGQPNRTVNYAYTATTITLSAQGETVTANLNGEGKITALNTPIGNIAYQYHTTSGLLQKVTFADQTSEEYIYTASAPYLLKELKHGSDTFAYWDYDNQNRVIRSWHAGDFDSTTFAYNTNDVLVTNPLGKGTRYIFETIDNARLVKEVQGQPSPNCAAENKAYDYYPNGTLKSKTDWEGNTTTYIRDALGRETSRTEASDTPHARTITTEYHPTWNKPIRIIEPGLATEYQYDPNNGRLLNTKKIATNL